MNGIIVSFRRGRHTQTCNQMVVRIDGSESKDKAATFVGKSVVWTSPAGKELHGKISSAHGNKGAVRVLFETGMPGQSLGQKVQLK